MGINTKAKVYRAGMWDCGKRVRDRERPNDRAESFRKFNCPPWILAILPYALESICESQDFLWKRQLRKVKVLFRELPKVRGEPEWARYYIFLLLIRAAVRNRHRKLSFSNIPSFHSFSTSAPQSIIMKSCPHQERHGQIQHGANQEQRLTLEC